MIHFGFIAWNLAPMPRFLVDLIVSLLKVLGDWFQFIFELLFHLSLVKPLFRSSGFADLDIFLQKDLELHVGGKNFYLTTDAELDD